MTDSEDEIDEILLESEHDQGRQMSQRVFRPRANNQFTNIAKTTTRFRFGEEVLEFLVSELQPFLAPQSNRSFALTTRQRVSYSVT